MFLEKVYSGKNSWPLYIATLLIVFIAIQIAGIPLAIYMLVSNPEAAVQGNMGAFTSTNTGLALTLLTFVGGFFALFLCVRLLQGKKYLDIVTARSRFDWNRFFFGAGIWAILTLLTFAITIFTSEDTEIVFQFDAANFIILVLISLIFLPFQTAFEEILFRGYIMQGAALFFKSKWISFLFTAIVFSLMHIYNPEIKAFGIEVALPQYIVMGLLLGYIALKDNGLELAIGLHFANNFLAAVTFTSDASALQTHALFKDLDPTASHLDTIVMLIAGVLFIGICNKKYRFLGDEVRPLPANEAASEKIF